MYSKSRAYFQVERNKALSFSLSSSHGEKAVLQAIQAIQVDIY